MKKCNKVIILMMIISLFTMMVSCDNTHVHTMGDWEIYIKATCEEDGEEVRKCVECEEIVETRVLPATGHLFLEDADSHFYNGMCLNNCGTFKNPQNNTLLDEITLSYNNGGEYDRETIYNVFAELDAINNSLEKYDPAIHYFQKDSELYLVCNRVDELLDDLYYNVLPYVNEQIYIANQLIYIINNDEIRDTYFELVDIQMKINEYAFGTIEFYFESSLREYYYPAEDGWTEEYILQLISSYDLGDCDKLKNEIDRLRKELSNISDDELETIEYSNLYHEFVNVCNLYIKERERVYEREYGSYFDYLYKYSYNRDYVYKDLLEILPTIKSFSKQLSKYILTTYDYIENLEATLTNEDKEKYDNIMSNDFFTNSKSVKDVGEYYNNFMKYYESNIFDYEQIYEDFLENHRYIYCNGQYAQTVYKGDFVYIDYNTGYYGSTKALVHELGHYINDKYCYIASKKKSIPYDFMEVHSIGNEILFTNYLIDEEKDIASKLFHLYNFSLDLKQMLESFIAAEFEYIIFQNDFEGNPIDASQYDEIYLNLLEEYGCEYLIYRKKWTSEVRHSTGYYISYAFSNLYSAYLDMIYKTQGREEAYNVYFAFAEYNIDGNENFTQDEWFKYHQISSYLNEDIYNEILDYYYNDYVINFIEQEF